MPLFGRKTERRKDSCTAIVEAVKDGNCYIEREGQKISLEEAIGTLADEEMEGLFEKLAESVVSKFTNADTEEKTKIKHQYRTLLGPRYGCLLLTSVALKEVTTQTFDKDPAAVSLRACVEESLQWHREAVFAEGLIYYIDDQSKEKLLHECAVVKLDPKINLEQPMRSFLKDLKGYVREYGSSVRTKAHLKLIRFPEIDGTSSPRLRSDPLPTPNRVDPKDYDEPLDLPERDNTGRDKQEKVGDQNRFREIVRQHLGQNLRLENNFEVIHYSAGSDSIGNVKDVQIRATAHLYVIFQKKMGESIALDYTIAMRETLGRLTVAFALERMRLANDELQKAREREEERHKGLQARVRQLAENIQGLQSSAYEVMTLVAPSVWRSLRDWVGIIGTLSDAKSVGKFPFFSGLKEIGSKHNWSEEQYAAALLRLVNYKDKPDEQLKTVVDVWNSEKTRVTKNPQDFSTEHPMWRSLSRMGVLDSELDKLNDSTISSRILKDDFYDKRAVFEANGFTILCLLLAVGADIDASKNGAGRGISKSTEIILIQPLRADIVVDGLNMIHDTLTEKKACGLQTVLLQFDETENQEFWFSIRFNNKRAAEFRDLCNQVAKITTENKEKHPGYQRHDMSMSILTALGLNEENWIKDLSGIQIGSAELSFAPKTANECIARCWHADGFLVISYKTRISS